MSLLQQKLPTAMFAVPDFKFPKLGSKWKKYVGVEVSTVYQQVLFTSSIKNRNKH
jgi:hypothetical protein